MHERRILVVEDDDSIRELLIDYLQLHALSVDAARDGVEALHQISTIPYNVVVLDVMMPKMSGVDLLDSLKAMTSDPSLKSLEQLPAVLVVTAAEKNELPDDELEHRFDGLVRGVFRKPLDMAAFGEELERCLGRVGVG